MESSEKRPKDGAQQSEDRSSENGLKNRTSERPKKRKAEVERSTARAGRARTGPKMDPSTERRQQSESRSGGNGREQDIMMSENRSKDGSQGHSRAEQVGWERSGAGRAASVGPTDSQIETSGGDGDLGAVVGVGKRR